MRWPVFLLRLPLASAACAVPEASEARFGVCCSAFCRTWAPKGNNKVRNSTKPFRLSPNRTCAQLPENSTTRRKKRVTLSYKAARSTSNNCFVALIVALGMQESVDLTVYMFSDSFVARTFCASCLPPLIPRNSPGFQVPRSSDEFSRLRFRAKLGQFGGTKTINKTMQNCSRDGYQEHAAVKMFCEFG